MWRLIEAMASDGERRLTRSTWDAVLVAERLDSTFAHSLSLGLRVAGSSATSGDMPELVRAMGWASVVRDLEGDLAKGLCNIPVSVVDHDAWIAGDVTAVARAARASTWWREHRLNAVTLVKACRDREVELRSWDATAARIHRVFRRGVERWIQRTR